MIKTMKNPNFKIIRTTQTLIDHQVIETEYEASDYDLGKWEVEVEHIDGTKSYVGSYRTKTEAAEAMRGIKRSKALWR